MRMRVATIRGQLLLFSTSSRCGYYSRAATIQGAASIRINTVALCISVHNNAVKIKSKMKMKMKADQQYIIRSDFAAYSHVTICDLSRKKDTIRPDHQF